jgi:hypothetical protein
MNKCPKAGGRLMSWRTLKKSREDREEGNDESRAKEGRWGFYGVGPASENGVV